MEMFADISRPFVAGTLKRGRDFKAWPQMAMFILPSYLTEGEILVLLYYTKVFRPYKVHGIFK